MKGSGATQVSEFRAAVVRALDKAGLDARYDALAVREGNRVATACSSPSMVQEQVGGELARQPAPAIRAQSSVSSART